MNTRHITTQKIFCMNLFLGAIIVIQSVSLGGMNQPQPVDHELFFQAAKKDDAQCIRELLQNKRVNINAQDASGKTALSWSSYNKSAMALQELLKYHPDLNLANKYGWTPLKKAASCGNVKAVSLLIDAGADVNCADDEGYTPLMNAHDNTEITQILISAGAHVNHQAFKDGTTPLMWATIESRKDVIQLLIAAGATDTLFNKRGENARMIAAKKSDPSLLGFLEKEFGKISVAKDARVDF